MVFPYYTGCCRDGVNAGRSLCICRPSWRHATWKYHKKISKSCNSTVLRLHLKPSAKLNNLYCKKTSSAHKEWKCWKGQLNLARISANYETLEHIHVFDDGRCQNVNCMPPQKHIMPFPCACWAVWCWGGFLTAKSVIPPLPGKALPPLGSSSSWKSKITQISVGCPGPAGRQGCVSAPWDSGCSQRTSPSLLALGEGSEEGLWDYFPAPLFRRRQICLKYDDMCLEDKIESGGALGELWLAVHLVAILLNVCLDI